MSSKNLGETISIIVEKASLSDFNPDAVGIQNDGPREAEEKGLPNPQSPPLR